MQRGKFITFEGSEGCGKSTQITRFLNLLESRQIPFIQTREPGGTVVGEKIRQLLQYDPETRDLCDESELLLFAASRAQLVRNVIEPTLLEGTWVIADRFLDSTTVYQGVGRGLDVETVKRINDFAVGETRPDLTFLLDLDVEVGHARAIAASGGREDRMEAQPMAFFQAVRSGYLSLAGEEPDRFAVIDASAEKDEVTASIQSVFQERLGGGA
ncbi:MAG: dTMP kinase [Verrucomicrobiales bacterium]|jgi:dTMP kinase|nr:dTMP kinase [Verrucomicrobiales bacterium]